MFLQNQLHLIQHLLKVAQDRSRLIQDRTKRLMITLGVLLGRKAAYPLVDASAGAEFLIGRYVAVGVEMNKF